MSNPATGNTLSIFSLLDALRRRKLYVIVPTLLLTLGFGSFAYLQPNRYRGTALIAAEQTTPPEYLKHVAPPPLNIEEHLWTVRQVLFSEPVLEAAARELKENQNASDRLSSAEIEEFKSHIDVKVESEHTFTIAYESPDRQGAMAVTNKLADLFVHYASASHEEKNKEAATVIDNQLDALKQRLTNQSKQLHAYKTQAVHALPDHIDDNIRAVDSLKTQNQERETKISEGEARRSSIQQELQALEAKGVLDETVVVRDKSADELKLDEMRLKQKELESRYTLKHPEVLQAQRRLRDLEAIVAAQPPAPRAEPSPTYLRYVELKSELEGIDQRIKSYRRDQQHIAGEIAKYSERIESTPQNERVIEDMQREYQVGELQFHALLDKQLDAKLAKGFEESETYVAFVIVEPASLPTVPYSPQRGRLVLMGLFAGLGLGLLTAFCLEQNDTTFGTVDDFQAFTTLPVIGVIPNVAKKTQKKQCGRNERLTQIVTGTDPDSVAAEQYRVLAMKLQQQAEASHAKVVMITSAAGGEGKSLTGINLAIAFASIVEGKVLLVDADMRKPSISQYLGMTVRPGKGFHYLLTNPDADLEECVDKVDDIYVIAGNVPPGNPVAALASRKARVVFDRLKEEYAFIIVDAPPTLSIADSHLLSGAVDKVLFVVRARVTARELFQHAVESFDATNLLGAVLNDVDYQRSRYAYAYEYYKKSAA